MVLSVGCRVWVTGMQVMVRVVGCKVQGVGCRV